MSENKLLKYPELDLNKISDRIKYIRLINKQSQKDFSNQINISLRTLQTYEQGKVESIPYQTLKDIVEQFNISLEWLFFCNGEVARDENKTNSDTADADQRLKNIENKVDSLLEIFSQVFNAKAVQTK